MSEWQTKSRPEPTKLSIDILVNHDVLRKWYFWQSLTDKEISALGLVEEITEKGTITGLYVSDIFLLKQTGSMAETTLDPKAISALMISLEKEGRDSSQLRFWIHSHQRMSVFWSGTDQECAQSLSNGAYSVSLVTNKARDQLMRLDMYHPCHLYLESVDFGVRENLGEDEATALKAEFYQKVTIETFEPFTLRKADQTVWLDEVSAWMKNPESPGSKVKLTKKESDRRTRLLITLRDELLERERAERLTPFQVLTVFYSFLQKQQWITAEEFKTWDDKVRQAESVYACMSSSNYLHDMRSNGEISEETFEQEMAEIEPFDFGEGIGEQWYE